MGRNPPMREKNFKIIFLLFCCFVVLLFRCTVIFFMQKETLEDILDWDRVVCASYSHYQTTSSFHRYIYETGSSISKYPSNR